MVPRVEYVWYNVEYVCYLVLNNVCYLVLNNYVWYLVLNMYWYIVLNNYVLHAYSICVVPSPRPAYNQLSHQQKVPHSP